MTMSMIPRAKQALMPCAVRSALCSSGLWWLGPRRLGDIAGRITNHLNRDTSPIQHRPLPFCLLYLPLITSWAGSGSASEGMFIGHIHNPHCK
ncbi:hypothetical protein BDQ94DRAFT_150223 [Aspergillus welwitschiae]|uniref:Uncharacterized protein n=1 Tax=Aspergillus welwitschiae TaxID=1341132 RepID=A0A3F3PRZ5_9EURO|nr:hypothetical protein BDQ94DRAFT_150223 [Aspergillus welwitschiae]RDH29697.1 hypothetical protein BDQ94DRAFT_150223 [Aspergillus welwitschiae]